VFARLFARFHAEARELNLYSDDKFPYVTTVKELKKHTKRYEILQL